MECRYCTKVIMNKGSLAAHEKGCEKNPNRVKQTRSPKAGAKKGSTPWNKGKEVDEQKVRWKQVIPTESILVANSPHSRKVARSRILDEGLIPYTCKLCGIGPEWYGKPMPLILDHINGVNDDHRLENLRFVCSNCDSTLDTYKARNK